MPPFLVLLLLLAASPSAALACSCVGPDGTGKEITKRDFDKAATVAIMKVMSFETVQINDRPQYRAVMLPVYFFKDAPDSPQSFYGTGVYSKSSTERSDCDIELNEGDLVIAFADASGRATFGVCRGGSAPLSFSALPYLYQLEGACPPPSRDDA